MVTDKLVESYLASGTTAYKAGEFQTAGKMFFAAYQKSRKFVKSDPRLATVYASLSLFYYQQKRYKKCETLLENALEILIGAEQFATAQAHNIRTQLANVYLAQQKLPALMSFYKDCLERFQKLENYRECSQFYDRIIDLYGAQGKMRQAEAWCKRAIQDDKRLFKENEAEAKKRLIRLAWIYSEQGRTQDAITLYKNSLASKPESQFQTAFPQAIVRTSQVPF